MSNTTASTPPSTNMKWSLPRENTAENMLTRKRGAAGARIGVRRSGGLQADPAAIVAERAEAAEAPAARSGSCPAA